MTATTNQRASHGSSGCRRASRDPIAIVAHNPVIGTTTRDNRGEGKKCTLSTSTTTPITANQSASTPGDSSDADPTVGRVPLPLGSGDPPFASPVTLPAPPWSSWPAVTGTAAASADGSRGGSGRRYIHH